MFIRGLPTIRLQIFSKIYFNLKGTGKGIVDPDDNFKRNLKEYTSKPVVSAADAI